MTPHGVCYRDSKHGFWPGTFRDACHPDAIAECEQTARALAAPEALPRDGEVVRVIFNEEAIGPMDEDTSAEIKRNQRIYQALINRISQLDSLIAGGKGTWPNKDYVRDETWAAWIGERSGLVKVLNAGSVAKG